MPAYGLIALAKRSNMRSLIAHAAGQPDTHWVLECCCCRPQALLSQCVVRQVEVLQLSGAEGSSNHTQRLKRLILLHTSSTNSTTTEAVHDEHYCQISPRD